MDKRIKSRYVGMLRYIPLIICIFFACVYLLSNRNVSVNELLSIAPEETFFAAVFMIALYVFKSLTVFFPIVVLNVLGGLLFKPYTAIIVNFIGVFIELTIPYWIGRVSGKDFASKLEAKHPKIAKIFGENSESLFFLSVFLRALFCLPGDAISMYFGAIKMPYCKYILGSMIGIIPGTIAATFLGMNITKPDSPVFWISLLSTIGFAAISLAIYCVWKKIRRIENDN